MGLMRRCAQTHAGKATEVKEDLEQRGGMFTSRRLISPSQTAWRCSATASITQPGVNGEGSMYCQPDIRKSYRLSSHSTRSSSFRMSWAPMTPLLSRMSATDQPLSKAARAAARRASRASGSRFEASMAILVSVWMAPPSLPVNSVTFRSV